MQTKRLTMILAASLGLGAPAVHAGDWGGWELYQQATPAFPISVYYKTKVDRDEIRVAWRCVNEGDRTRSCSVGAGQNKVYYCFSGYSNVGTTQALGERATIAAGGEYTFMSEGACQNTGADHLSVDVRISIED